MFKRYEMEREAARMVGHFNNYTIAFICLYLALESIS